MPSSSANSTNPISNFFTTASKFFSDPCFPQGYEQYADSRIWAGVGVLGAGVTGYLVNRLGGQAAISLKTPLRLGVVSLLSGIVSSFAAKHVVAVVADACAPWETKLDEWFKEIIAHANTQNETIAEERINKYKKAKTRIEACIKNNGHELNLSGLALLSLPPVLYKCKNLKKLDCSDNLLSGVLNLKGFGNLSELDCNGNQLTQLNLEGCNSLSKLNCNTNELTGQLNLNGFKKLSELRCSENKLTGLNLQGCNSLSKLYCLRNNLKRLNLAEFKKLSTLWCGDNQLKQLNLNGCSNLSDIQCPNNNKLNFDNFDFLSEKVKDFNFLNTSLHTALRQNQLPDKIRDRLNRYLETD